MQRAICAICYDDLWAPNSQVVSYVCGHVHHLECVLQMRNRLCPCCRRPLEDIRVLFIELVPNDVDVQQNLNSTLIPMRGTRERRFGQDTQYNLPLFQMAPGNDMDFHQFFLNLPQSNLWRQIYNALPNHIQARINRDLDRDRNQRNA